jgi:hypothetical protein
VGNRSKTSLSELLGGGRLLDEDVPSLSLVLADGNRQSPLVQDKRFLVAYNYGQGAVWAWVIAPSAAAIVAAFPELSVVDDPPEWLDAGQRGRLPVLRLDQPTGLLADIVNGR